jgi:DNA-binding NarL/FixJ family response regulator
VHLGAEAAGYLREEQAGIRALTPRELEVLGLLAEGCSNQGIARRLAITERTARTHASNLLGKLHLGSRTQAALLARAFCCYQTPGLCPCSAPGWWQRAAYHATPVG